uniref:ARAD1C07106p n=1 Tax=Blastobotrys adeninivorans TaxID=409370 RepID=A0A060T4Z2_BLAAD
MYCVPVQQRTRHSERATCGAAYPLDKKSTGWTTKFHPWDSDYYCELGARGWIRECTIKQLGIRLCRDHGYGERYPLILATESARPIIFAFTNPGAEGLIISDAALNARARYADENGGP